MKICHVCKAECLDEAELCPICGADLSVDDETANEVKTEPVLIENPVIVASFEDIVSAEIFRDILEENGIRHAGSETDEGTIKVSFGGVFTADDIYVDESDLERASELYEEFMNSEQEFVEEFFDDEEFSEE